MQIRLRRRLRKTASSISGRAGRKLGIDFPKLTGRQAILDALLPFLGPLDTSHTASNLQIEISGDAATLLCLCDVATFHAAGRFAPRIGERAFDEPL